MTVDIVYNGKKYFLKLNYPGPNHFKFEVLEFSNLDQIKELKSKLAIAIAAFETSAFDTAMLRQLYE